MGRPHLGKIEEKLEKGKEFELSNQQYKNLTETDFPKSKYYAEKVLDVYKSALEAKQNEKKFIDKIKDVVKRGFDDHP